MADEETTETTETTADPDDAALVAEVEELTRPEADKDRDKVKNALIAAKRELRNSNRKIKELEPIAASAQRTNQQLETAQPIINAILQNPKLRAEALRITQGGTRPTPEGGNQLTADDDPDAAEFAELNNFYEPDGMTLDIARGKRGLALLDRRHGKQTDERMRPLAGITLDRQANENIRAALNATDNDGTPWATRESIEEAAKMIPKHLLADPGVADLILNNAIGMDRRKGRTPKPVDEPLFLDRQNHGGRQREAALSEMERRHIAASGISEKEYRASAAKLEQGAASRRGIELGK